MNKNAVPIPVRSVVCLPRWMMLTGVTVCSVLLVACLALAAHGIIWAEARGSRWGAIGGGLGGAIGCLGGLYGTLNDWYRRLPAKTLLWCVQHDEPMPFYRRVFWPAVVVGTVGIVIGCLWSHRAIWQGVVQTSGILAFIAGSQELIRRHTTRQARALFALYADGALAADDADAIDAARRQDAAFDEEVRAFQAIGERVRRLTSEP